MWTTPGTYMMLFNVASQGIDVGGEGFAAGVRDVAQGLGHLALESLGNFYISGLLQFVDLNAQIARCGPGLRLKVDEIGLRDIQQDGHHREPQLRMEQRIKRYKIHVVHIGLTGFLLQKDSGDDEDKYTKNCEDQDIGRVAFRNQG